MTATTSHTQAVPTRLIQMKERMDGLEKEYIDARKIAGKSTALGVLADAAWSRYYKARCEYSQAVLAWQASTNDRNIKRMEDDEVAPPDCYGCATQRHTCEHD